MIGKKECGLCETTEACRSCLGFWCEYDTKVSFSKHPKYLRMAIIALHQHSMMKRGVGTLSIL